MLAFSFLIACGTDTADTGTPLTDLTFATIEASRSGEGGGTCDEEQAAGFDQEPSDSTYQGPYGPGEYGGRCCPSESSENGQHSLCGSNFSQDCCEGQVGCFWSNKTCLWM